MKNDVRRWNPVPKNSSSLVVRPLIWNSRHEPFVSLDETNFCIDILHGETHLTTLHLHNENEEVGRDIICIPRYPSFVDANNMMEVPITNPLNHNHIVATYVENYSMFIIRHEKKISCILLPPGTQFQVTNRELSLKKKPH